MNVIRKIELSDTQAAWLDKEIANGNIASEAALLEEAITERIHQQNTQNPKYLNWLEAELQKGLDSGISKRDLSQIRADARQKVMNMNG